MWLHSGLKDTCYHGSYAWTKPSLHLFYFSQGHSIVMRYNNKYAIAPEIYKKLFVWWYLHNITLDFLDDIMARYFGYICLTKTKVFDFISIGKRILLHCVIKDGYIALVAIKEEATSAIKHLHYWQDTFCRFSIPPILN